MKVSYTHLFAFSYGFGWSVIFNFFGTVYASELVALVSLAIFGARRVLPRTVDARRIIAGFSIVLLGLLLSDLWNSTPIGDALRGWANPTLAAVNFLFLLALLRRRPDAVLLVLAGISFGNLTSGELQTTGSSALSANFVKESVVPTLTPAILVLSFYLAKVRNRAAGLLFLSSGLMYLALGARSAGLVLIIAGTLVFLGGRLLRYGLPGLVAITAAILPLTYVAFNTYVNYVLSEGGSGNSAWQVAMMKNPFDPAEWIIHGRTDAIVALHAIMDKPLLGHGSWAKDVTGAYSELGAQLRQVERVSYSDLIRGHSVILTAAVWGGVTSLLGIMIVFIATIRGIYPLIKSDSALQPIALALTIDFLWNFLFSPFGHIRTSFPLIMALAAAWPFGQSFPAASFEGQSRVHQSTNRLEQKSR